MTQAEYAKKLTKVFKTYFIKYHDSGIVELHLRCILNGDYIALFLNTKGELIKVDYRRENTLSNENTGNQG